MNTFTFPSRDHLSPGVFSPMNLHLLTFAGGEKYYFDAAGRIAREAKESGFFRTVRVETSETLQHIHKDFWSIWEPYIKKHTRMYGFGVWKPFLIHHHLLSIPRGHVLLYLDSGCILNGRPKARAKLQELYEMVLLSSSLSVALDSRHFGWSYSSFEERRWSKKELLDRLSLTLSQRNANQRQGGILFFKHDSLGVDFVKRWMEFSTSESGFFLSEDFDSTLQEQDFIAHRHEQSTFSCLSKVYGLPAISDFTWHAPLWHLSGRNEPIWAARWRRGDSFNISNPGVLRFQLAAIKGEMLHQIRRYR